MGQRRRRSLEGRELSAPEALGLAVTRGGGRELMLNTCEPLSHIGLAVGLSDRAACRACSASTWASVLSSGPLVAGGRGNRAALSRRTVPLLDRLFGLSSPA